MVNEAKSRKIKSLRNFLFLFQKAAASSCLVFASSVAGFSIGHVPCKPRRCGSVSRYGNQIHEQLRPIVRRFITANSKSLYLSPEVSFRGNDSKGADFINSNKIDNVDLIRDEARSNFWSTTSRSVQDGDADSSVDNSVLHLPNVPTMDYDGPLPQGAYRMLGNCQFEVKPTCLLTVAVDVQPRCEKDSDEMNPHLIVKRMQRFIDSGMTTFSLRLPDAVTNSNSWCQDWAEENVYGRLLRDTPATALAQTQLVVPMTLPTHGEPDDRSDAVAQELDGNAPLSATSIRKQVLGSLQRMGADCIDTLQLQYVKSSPYHLEVLDYLSDLQREGLIRSIAGRNIPPELLDEAHYCGFHFDNNQFDGGSLLMPLDIYDYDDSTNNIASASRRRKSQRHSLQKTMSQTGTRLVVASPLAGGLLTDRHFGKPLEPKPWHFASDSERQHYFYTTVPQWFRQQQQRKPQATAITQQRRGGSVRTRSKDTSRWSTYQRQLLQPLQEIAWKHCVSIAAVSLRFALQQQQAQQLQGQKGRRGEHFDPFLLASVAVACRLGGSSDEDEERWDRPQQLRQVFRFALDEEDMEQLKEISYVRHEDANQATSSSWESEWGDGMDMDWFEEQLFLKKEKLPDIANRKLWL